MQTQALTADASRNNFHDLGLREMLALQWIKGQKGVMERTWPRVGGLRPPGDQI